MKIAGEYQRPNSLANKRRQPPLRTQSFRSPRSNSAADPFQDNFLMDNPMVISPQSIATSASTPGSDHSAVGTPLSRSSVGSGGQIMMRSRSMVYGTHEESAVAASSAEADTALRLMRIRSLRKSKIGSPCDVSPRPMSSKMRTESTYISDQHADVENFHSPIVCKTSTMSMMNGFDGMEIDVVDTIDELDSCHDYETDSDDTDAGAEAESALHVEIGDSKAEWLEYIHDSFRDGGTRASITLEGLDLQHPVDGKTFNHEGTTSNKENENDRKRSSSFYRLSTELDEVSAITSEVSDRIPAPSSSASTAATVLAVSGESVAESTQQSQQQQKRRMSNESIGNKYEGTGSRRSSAEILVSASGSAFNHSPDGTDFSMGQFQSETVRFGDIYEGSTIDQEQTLMEAALNNDHKAISYLIADHPEFLDVVNEEDQTALHLACKASSIESIRLLALRSNALQINAVDKAGRSPLHLCKTASSVEALGDSNSQANVNQMDYAGYTPLLTYVMAGRAECVTVIMRLGANPAIAGPDQNRNALHIAADLSNFEMVHSILGECQHMNFDIPEAFFGEAATPSTSPLKQRISSAYKERLSDLGLRRSSADYDMEFCSKLCATEDEDGNVALHLVASSEQQNAQQMQCIIALLNAQSDINAKNSREVTAMHFVCANVALRAVSEPLLEIMIALGGDVNAADVDGCTPLLVACCYREYTLCKLLLQAGADMNLPCHIKSPFMHANPLKIARKSIEGPSDYGAKLFETNRTSSVSNTSTAPDSDSMNNESYCTASDLMAKTPRLHLFRFLSAMQTRIPGIARSRCMNCAAHMSGSDSVSFFAKLGLVSGRHHCRHCNRVVCSSCSAQELPRDMMPDFVKAVTDESRMRVCTVCYSVLSQHCDC